MSEAEEEVNKPESKSRMVNGVVYVYNGITNAWNEIRKTKEERRAPDDKLKLDMFMKVGNLGETYARDNLMWELDRLFKNGYPLLKDKNQFIEDNSNNQYIKPHIERFRHIITEQGKEEDKKVTSKWKYGGGRKSRKVKKSKRKRTKKSKTKKRRSTRRK